MKIIFTMAGEYTRFHGFSSEVPKYLLPAKNGLIIDSVISPFIKNDNFNEVIFVCNEKDKKFINIIQERLKLFKKGKTHLIYLNKTFSQVETALDAIKKNNLQNSISPILITNIDTILLNRDFEKINKELTKCDGILDTFEAYDKNYSYVMPNEKNEIINIKEKIQISEIAASGLYGFSSITKFYKRAYGIRKKIKNFSELYQSMIDEGNKIKMIHTPSTNNTIVVGTPNQYIDFISSK
ncbi:sugar phosphate nucleotidyltransferase [Alphaproteobacteria bacterium]|nr:sugar phosphate nucleotidyltransferase [Alphaproteobacteria bacterium]